jgi:hypothetical protein
MTNVQVNRVGHCEAGTSNKVYIASIVREQDTSGTVIYTVVGKGSAVFKNMRTYRKGSYYKLENAIEARDDLFDAKIYKSSKAYIDIESAEYNGTLSMTSTSWLKSNLEPDLNQNMEIEDDGADAFQEAEVNAEVEEYVAESKSESKSKAKAKDWEVICVNNLGMEDSFDEGVEYIAEKHSESDMIYVWDKQNVKVECFTERFKDAQYV